ncbi:MAG: carbohydrate kinase family protein [Bacillota bacterium]
MANKTICFGEMLWDVIDDEEYIGGAPFNVAAHMKKLNLDSTLISRLGEDRRGERAFRRLTELGINEQYIQFDSYHPTGWVEVNIKKQDAPSYIIKEGVAWDHIVLDKNLERFLKNNKLDFFYFGTLAQRNDVSRNTLAKILNIIDADNIFLDINIRQDYFNKDIIEKSLRTADILKLNNEETEILSRLLYNNVQKDKELCQLLKKDYNLNIICITRGGEGSSVFFREEYRNISGYKVEVVDTIGAGDAFSAGFIYLLSCGKDPLQAAKFGNYLGAFVAGKRSSVPSYKRKKIINDYNPGNLYSN